MPSDRVPAVIHITAAAGGGVDRYVRDLAATTGRRHYLLHAGAAVDVLEDIEAHRFVPLAGLGGERASAPLRQWLADAGVGIAHLHGVDETCRARLGALRRAATLPYIVTLHDLLFLNPRAFEAARMPEPDAAWIGGLAPALTEAAMVIAPSAFLRDIAADAVPGMRTTIIAPGLRPSKPMPTPPAPSDFAAMRPQRLVAIVGAVGPHKGSGILEELVAALGATDIGVVVIGYTDTRLARGWATPGRLYLHGPYEDDTLAGWLAAYDVGLVLFPNRLPESFSYTLSEVWSTGIPVIVPDDGALGARVATHGGGWRLPSGFAATDAAALIGHLLSDKGATEMARVKSEISRSDPTRVPPLSPMSREIDNLYAHYAISPTLAPATAAAREALAPLLAANLDGFAFRAELLNLASQLQQAHAALDAARQRCAELERDGAAWATKLEGDIATLRRELTLQRERPDAEVHRIRVAKAQVDEQVRRLVAETARLEEERRRQEERARSLATLNSRSIEDNRRLLEENARAADANSRLASDGARQANEIRQLQELARTLEQAGAATPEALRASAQRQREGAALAAGIERDNATARRALAVQIEQLGAENIRLSEYEAALGLLPAQVRNYLIKRIVRARR